jgi:hypothetical protein
MYEDEKGMDWLQSQWLQYAPSADFGKDWDI